MAGTTRRHFLELALAAPALVLFDRTSTSAAQRGLDQFMVPLAPCKNVTATPAVPDLPYFKAGSPERVSIAEPGAPGRKLKLSGTVSGVTCGFIKGAKLDVWQADASGAYDQAGYLFRGHQLTDGNGRYRLETVIPGAHGSRTRLLNVRIDVNGKRQLVTQIFFPDEPLNARDQAFRTDLAMTVVAPGVATFDFLLNM